jgi:hypothetical protein
MPPVFRITVGEQPAQWLVAQASKIAVKPFSSPSPAPLPPDESEIEEKWRSKHKSLLIRKLHAPLTEPQKESVKRDMKSESLRLEMIRYLNAVKINIRTLDKWRWLGFVFGVVEGLPTTRGRAVMTDGVVVLVERPDGSVIRCHFDWFVKDQKGSGKSKRELSPQVVKKAQELFEMLRAL